MINWHQITDPTIYEQDRFNEIRNLEGPRSLPYLDTKGIPSIGIGFNLRTMNVRNAVFEAMGIDTSLLTDPNAIAAEQGYISQLETALNQRYSSNSALRSALNPIMAQRATDPVLASYPYISSRTTFTMTDPEIETAFNDIIPDYEATLNAWLPGIPQSDERLALVSLAYNGLIGFKADGSLKSPALHQALVVGNRAEAWYEIRYRSNADTRQANRRVQESDLFSLYDEQGPGIPEDEAKSVLQMYTLHKATILSYESRYASAFQSNNESIQSQIAMAKAPLIAVYALGQTIDGDVLVGQDGPAGSTALVGTPQNDLIFGGNSSGDVLLGNLGNDVIYGNQGNDQIVAGPGNDTLLGGAGNDQLEAGAGNNVLDDGVNEEMRLERMAT